MAAKAASELFFAVEFRPRVTASAYYNFGRRRIVQTSSYECNRFCETFFAICRFVSDSISNKRRTNQQIRFNDTDIGITLPMHVHVQEKFVEMQ